MRSSLAAVLLALAAAPLRAQTLPQDVPMDLVHSAREEVSPEGLATWAVTGAAFAVARPDDGRVKRAVLVNPPPVSTDLAHAGTYLGNAGVLFGAAAATYGAGWAAKSPRAREFGAMSFEALALAGLQTEILKYAARRRRPDGADLASFPSGHAAESFAVASVAASEFGWWGAPACLAAGFVGYSRLQNNKHWLSDVVFGTGVGVVSGRAVWRAHRGRKGRRVALLPVVTPDSTGLLVVARF